MSDSHFSGPAAWNSAIIFLTCSYFSLALVSASPLSPLIFSSILGSASSIGLTTAVLAASAAFLAASCAPLAAPSADLAASSALLAAVFALSHPRANSPHAVTNSPSPSERDMTSLRRECPRRTIRERGTAGDPQSPRHRY